jgi:CubicO group peptidase (beta-lactamase class C family)
MATALAMSGKRLAGALLAIGSVAAPQPAQAQAPVQGTGAASCRITVRDTVANDRVARDLATLLSRYEGFGFSGSVLVIRRGEVLLNRGYGRADTERRIRNRPETLYDIGSIAKTFTAAAILDLEARGLLSLEDRLSRFFPDVPPDKQAITVHQLLTHTAGFPLDVEHAGGGPADTDEQLLAKILSAPLRHAPGAGYHYSSVGYGVLALIVERVSGRSWQAYVRERLVDRAGLRHTYLWGEDRPRGTVLARGYIGASEDEVRPEPPVEQSAASTHLWGKHMLGSVGLFSTVGDLYLWWCALRSDRLLPAEQRARLFAIQAADQGYGWNIRQEGGATVRVSRGGLRGSYQTLISYYPQSDSLIIFGSNRNVGLVWPGLLWTNIAHALAGEPYPVPPRVGAASARALARIAGTYRADGGGLLHVRSNGEALFAGTEGQRAVDALVPGPAPSAGEREATEAASRALAAALAAGDPAEAARLGALSEQQRGALSEQWALWMRRTGGLARADLIGTTAAGPNRTRSFLRLSGPSGEQVVRFLWEAQGSRLLAWGDDIPLPAYLRLWPQSPTRFVSYDLQSDRTLVFDFAGGAVTVRARSGELLLSAASDGAPLRQ